MKKYIPVAGILALCLGALLYSAYDRTRPKHQQVRLLPLIGNKTLRGTDTIYHTVSPFSFINQLGNTITQEQVEGKNYVAEYFFTTCEGICPVMNKNMMKVAEAFKNDTTFRILSHTVKPEEDSVPVLLDYAKAHAANPSSWWFLTGDKKQLYELARKSYLMNNEEGDGGSDDFIHSQLFVLVDKHKRLRGFYDGTREEEVAKLISDVAVLKQEQALNSKDPD